MGKQFTIKRTEEKKQHITPCDDCPWARKAIPGWLGDDSVARWLNVAHGHGRMFCHTRTINRKAAQCAGAAIFRANVCQGVDPGNLSLPPDKVRVFSWDTEFAEHHLRQSLTNEQVLAMKVAELFSDLK